MSKILIVDDDSTLRRAVSVLLTRNDCEVSTAKGGREALDLLTSGNFDVVITDLKMENMSGLDLLRRIKANFPEVEVILMTAFGSISNAVEVMRAEAFDYITKPFKNEELMIVVNKALERRRLVAEVKYLREVLDYKYNFGTIIGQSPVIRKVVDLVMKYSSKNIPVLIHGEPGTGKELVAKSIHDNSLRKDRKFVSINCSGVPAELLKAELFGASLEDSETPTNREGALEKASGGTLFIDDIAEMHPEIQTALIEAFSSGRVPGNRPSAKLDVRLIVATTHDLQAEVKNGMLRRELYDMLSPYVISLPTLRDRGEDILLLAEHFIKKYAREFGKQPAALTSDAARMLLNHSWPGNVRELENTIRRTIALSKNETLVAEDLIMVADATEGPHKLLFKPKAGSKMSLEEKELEYIIRSLRENNWNYTRTAGQLGIGRTTLWRKMKKIKDLEKVSAQAAT